MMLEEHVQNEIDAAKQEGLEATRAVVEKWKHSKEYQWDILGVSAVTANKLINGEFKTFDELAKSRTEDRDLYSNVHILYRKKESVYRKMFNNYIIEAVFIDE